MGIHREEGDLTFARIERKTPVFKPAFQLNQRFLCSLQSSRDRGEGGLYGQVVSIKRAADKGR